MATVDFNITGFKDFFSELQEQAKGGFRKEITEWLDAVGNEFLRIVEEEIVRRKVIDTRNLLASFHKDADGNIWDLDEDGLCLEVGSEVEYASYVNDGHWTNPKGVAIRFVPGYFEGDRFIYDPSADTGMVLKQHWVEGAHYFDSALHAMNKILPGLAEKKLQEWGDKYFGG